MSAADIARLERELARLQVSLTRSPDLISPHLAIPGLQGFWPMSSVGRDTGAARDVSGQDRILTNNANTVFGYTGIVPWVEFDGTGDYLSRTDEAGLESLGTETIFSAAYAGGSAGGWFRADVLETAQLVGKYNPTGNQRSYRLAINSSGNVLAQLSNDGTAITTTTSSNVITAAAWFFAAYVWDPSTTLDVFVNGTWTRNTTSIPASLFNGSSAFTVGAAGDASNELDGRASLVWKSAMYLSDAIISSLYQQTRGAFGV